MGGIGERQKTLRGGEINRWNVNRERDAERGKYTNKYGLTLSTKEILG